MESDPAGAGWEQVSSFMKETRRRHECVSMHNAASESRPLQRRSDFRPPEILSLQSTINQTKIPLCTSLKSPPDADLS